MTNSTLEKYLTTGEIETQDAAILVVSAKNDDPFFELLANLCVVEMLAKDFHYRANGKAFYGEHLMADLIAEVGKESDDLNEIRYMGELQQYPPFRAYVAKRAVEIIDAIPLNADEGGLIEALYDRTNAVVGLVESCKKSGEIASGTTAVLDAISQKALQANGFLKRVLSGSDMATVVDADAAAPTPVE